MEMVIVAMDHNVDLFIQMIINVIVIVVLNMTKILIIKNHYVICGLYVKMERNVHIYTSFQF